jgi:hypothetical protein
MLSVGAMSPLYAYYLNQAGRGGRGGYGGIGPIYTSTPFVQRGHGIGSFLGKLFRYVKPYIWSTAKDIGRETLRSLGRESLRTGGRILTDIADRPHDVSARDIVTKHLGESTQKLIGKLSGRGKRKRSAKRKKQVKRRKISSIKRDIFS